VSTVVWKDKLPTYSRVPIRISLVARGHHILSRNPTGRDHRAKGPRTFRRRDGPRRRASTRRIHTPREAESTPETFREWSHSSLVALDRPDASRLSGSCLVARRSDPELVMRPILGRGSPNYASYHGRAGIGRGRAHGPYPHSG